MTKYRDTFNGYYNTAAMKVNKVWRSKETSQDMNIPESVLLSLFLSSNG